MVIGIDISQIVHEHTGVAGYVRNIVTHLVRMDTRNDYVLFGASLRKRQVFFRFFQGLAAYHGRVRLVAVPLPPIALDWLWNRLHVAPVEWFTGSLDVFWSSDWTQPPLLRAQGITTIHDLSILRTPEEFAGAGLTAGKGFAADIVETQKRRLKRVVKVCSLLLCDSEATKTDAMALLGIPEAKIRVVYPGYSG